MPWVIEENRLGQSIIGTVDDVATVSLGAIVRAKDPLYGAGEFIYLKGAASVADGEWVTYNLDDWTVTRLAANAIGPVAVARGAYVANKFGWYQISGKGYGKVLAGFVDNANVYATATAGSVDDAVVAGDRVKGVVGASAINTPTTGMAEMELARPFMDDGLAV